MQPRMDTDWKLEILWLIRVHPCPSVVKNFERPRASLMRRSMTTRSAHVTSAIIRVHLRL